MTDAAKQVKVGSYVLGSTLGTGACSKVKTAVHEVTGEEVAIKIVKKVPQGELDARTEIRVMSILQERAAKSTAPNTPPAVMLGASKADASPLIRLVEVMESKKFIYVVMEKVVAGDLFGHCVDYGLMGEGDSKFVFRRLLQGLAELHDSGVAHRDIKPENILVDFQENVVKLSDFGLARVHSVQEVDGDTETISCQAVGTKNYAAPEILSDLPGYNAYKADMYSLGVTMHVAMLGSFPPEEGFVHSTERHETLSEVASSLLSQLLHKDPRKRPTPQDALFHTFFEEADSEKSQ
eukprot:TRINITY_DN7900_c0_g1_i1.p2 TRINITY_DN7900_c0_g1~~TRINITY_DN7900_c0_g1_i1.p2  ORF type:complete len:294 (+),score=140.46 TRINITY_DN7900_c0_g1_i1:323-1204(+)